VDFMMESLSKKGHDLLHILERVWKLIYTYPSKF
jgi:hypothetical protein